MNVWGSWKPFQGQYILLLICTSDLKLWELSRQQFSITLGNFQKHSIKCTHSWKDSKKKAQLAIDVFNVQSGVTLSRNTHQMEGMIGKMHAEVLELISRLSDDMVSDDTSSIYRRLQGSQDSSTSFSILPPKPKVFHGRDLELEKIVTSLGKRSARIAILGAGGMGKTSLARAVLHHPDVALKYKNRFFVAADSSTTSVQLAEEIGLHLNLRPAKDLTKDVVRYLSQTESCLLILDNLETSWEPIVGRAKLEEFLSLL
ncbi:hypothetical protein C8R43DRAFT_932906, partial [Mycena crocata]